MTKTDNLSLAEYYNCTVRSEVTTSFSYVAIYSTALLEEAKGTLRVVRSNLISSNESLKAKLTKPLFPLEDARSMVEEAIKYIEGYILK